MELQNFGISEHRIVTERHRERSAAIQPGLLPSSLKLRRTQSALKPRNGKSHQPSTNTHQPQAGFSLIELSIVFVVIGILMTGALTFVSGYTKGHQIKETRMKLQAIEQALIVHVRKYGHIPCPASRTTQRGTASFGVSPTLCNTAPPGGTVDVNSGKVRIGMVPVKRLGLPEEHAFDGWGNRITYAAIRDLAVDQTTYNSYATTDTDGVIIIQDGNGNQLYPADDKNINAYALISHGSDGKGSFNRTGQVVNACNSAMKDGENCDSDSLFFDMPINDGDTESTYFNDYVRWKPVTSLNMDANSTNISTATGLPDCAAGETLISNGAGAYACGLPASSGGSEGSGFEGRLIAIEPYDTLHRLERDTSGWIGPEGLFCSPCTNWPDISDYLTFQESSPSTTKKYDLESYGAGNKPTYMTLDSRCAINLETYELSSMGLHARMGIALVIAFMDKDNNYITTYARPLNIHSISGRVIEGYPMEQKFSVYSGIGTADYSKQRPPGLKGFLLEGPPTIKEYLNNRSLVCGVEVEVSIRQGGVPTTTLADHMIYQFTSSSNRQIQWEMEAPYPYANNQIIYSFDRVDNMNQLIPIPSNTKFIELRYFVKGKRLNEGGAYKIWLTAFADSILEFYR